MRGNFLARLLYLHKSRINSESAMLIFVPRAGRSSTNWWFRAKTGPRATPGERVSLVYFFAHQGNYYPMVSAPSSRDKPLHCETCVLLQYGQPPTVVLDRLRIWPEDVAFKHEQVQDFQIRIF